MIDSIDKETKQTLAQVNCPTCGTSTPWSGSNKYRPFCCERCKLIDLGAWASEEHKIAGEPADFLADEEGSSGRDL